MYMEIDDMITQCIDGQEHKWRKTEDGQWCERCRMMLRDGRK